MAGNVPSFSVKLTQAAVPRTFRRPAPDETAPPINVAPTDILLSNASVDESAGEGFLVGNISVVDPNGGQKHVLTLSNSAGGRFYISGTQLLRGPIPLDYETATSHTVNITAADPGGLSHSEDIAITVNNVLEPPYDILLSASTVPELSAIDTVVGTLSVGGETGDWTYELLNDAGGRFKIANDDEVQVAALGLNYESGFFHDITVRAYSEDSGSDFIKTFRLTVTDVNEAPTDITLSNITVNEDVTPGTFIGSLSVVDPDFGDAVDWTLLNSAGSRFAISGNNLVAGATGFDYGANTSHTIEVRAEDSGGLSFDKEIVVFVAEVVGVPGNNAPTDIIVQTPTVAEYTAPGTLVSNISVVDPDAGDVHNLTLVNDAGGRFALNIQGQLITGLNTTRFTEGTQTVTIRATDGGGLSFTKSIGISVTNVEEDPYGITINNVVVNENSSPGTVIGGMTTLDPDPNSTFSYTLISTHAGRFALNGSNLVVGAAGVDFEAASSYEIDVRSTDQTGRSYVQRFVIAILDIDENPPGTSYNDYQQSTWNTNIGFLVAGRDFNVGRLSTNPLRSLITNPVSGINYAANTNCWRIQIAGTFDDIDFGDRFVQVEVGGVLLRNCRITDRGGPYPPPNGQGPAIGNNYRNGNARVDWDMEYCDVIGSEQPRAVSPAIDSNKGIVNAYRCKITGFASDAIKVAGGYFYECFIDRLGWGTGGHVDAVEIVGLIAPIEYHRCYMSMNRPAEGAGDFNAAFKIGPEERSLDAGEDILVEECVLDGAEPNLGPPRAPHYIIRANGGNGARMRFLNNYISGWVTQPFLNNVPLASWQGNRNHRTPTRLIPDTQVPSGKPAKPSVTLSSPGATTLTLAFTSDPIAGYYEYRIRVLGTARWSRVVTLPANKQITGLVGNTAYEVITRGVNITSGGGNSGDWSDKRSYTLGTVPTQLPGQITALNLTNAGPTSLTLSFVPSQGATSHEYRTGTAGTGTPVYDPTYTNVPFLVAGFGKDVGRLSTNPLTTVSAGAGVSISGTIITVTGDNITFADKDVRGMRIEVASGADNFRIHSSLLDRGGTPTFGSFAVRDFPAVIRLSGGSAIIEDNTFDGLSLVSQATIESEGGASFAVHRIANFSVGDTIRRNEVIRMPSDGFCIMGGLIEENYVPNTNGINPGAHYDCIEQRDTIAAGIIIRRNFLWGTAVNNQQTKSNACIKCYDGPYDGVTRIEENVLRGGSHTIMTFSYAVGTAGAHMEVVNNFFGDDAIWGSGYYITGTGTGGTTPSNVWFKQNKRINNTVLPDINGNNTMNLTPSWTQGGSETIWSDWATLAESGVIGSLASLTTYLIELRGSNTAGKGPVASISGTTTGAVAPGTITDAALVSKTTDSGTFDFTAASNADAYQQRNRLSGGAWGSWTSVSTTLVSGKRRAVISGLDDNTAYDVMFRGTNTAGNGADGNQVTFTTDEASTPGEDSDATALIGRMTTINSGVAPAAGWQTAINNLIVAIKAISSGDVWADMLLFYNQMVHSGNVVVLNWKADSFQATKGGTQPAFTQKLGYKGNWSWHMDTGFNPTTAGLGTTFSVMFETGGTAPHATWENDYVFGNVAMWFGARTTVVGSIYPFTGRSLYNSTQTGAVVDAVDDVVYVGSGDTSFAVDNGTDAETINKPSGNAAHENANFRFGARGGAYSGFCMRYTKFVMLFNRNLTTDEQDDVRDAINAYKSEIASL